MYTYEVYLNDKNGAYSDKLFQTISSKRGQPAASRSRFDSHEEALAFAQSQLTSLKDNEYITIGRFVDGEYDEDYNSLEITYQVEFHDFRTGATSPIDTIVAPWSYTPAEYLDSLDDSSEYVENGEIIFVEVQ